MSRITHLAGREILDSRGRPTVQAICTLESGTRAAASVPSGASTGSAEALELRDGNMHRYRGLGCRLAAGHVGTTVHQAVSGKVFETQLELDQALLALDGTPNKARLGANAILAVSLAFARAVAAERGIPLYAHFAEILDSGSNRDRSRASPALPRPTINLFSGGKHAGGQVPIQDVLIVPLTTSTMDDALAMAFEVYQVAVELCARSYGMRALTADEGGLAPPFGSAEGMIEAALEAIHAAGLRPGIDVALAVDVASSHFFRDGLYYLGVGGIDSPALIAHLLGWLDRYPIVSIEDGLAEEDWAHWPSLKAQVASRALVLGDDLLCTNSERIQRAITALAANALLLKVNQVGTLSEAADACRLARSAGWHITISARSGETEDDWLADLAVGWGGDQIKVGSITQSERLAKYNRLLEIEVAAGFPLAGGLS